MSVEANKQTARRFAEQVSSGRIDPAMLADGYVHWSAMRGEISADDLHAAMVRVGEIFAVPLELHVDRLIGEGDCVAMEAHSMGTLHSGAHYRNRYHYLFEFAPDGRIRRINEHMDSKHAYEVMWAPAAASPTQ